MIESWHPKITISSQCELLGLSRSGYYYQPQGESQLNLRLMNLIDEQSTAMKASGTLITILQDIFSFTIGRDSMSLWDTGHRMRCISATAEIIMLEKLAG